AMAERDVLAHNGLQGLATCALRPHLIIGPGDTNLIPTVVERARVGKLLQVGDGKNLVDFTYIDDCVAAHLLAARALEESPESRGRAYFISQGDPYPLWDWVREVLISGNISPELKQVPKALAYSAASLFELGSK